MKPHVQFVTKFTPSGQPAVMSVYCHKRFTTEGATPEFLSHHRSYASAYRRAESLPACGSVLLFNGVPFGWSLNPDPSYHVPGTVAVPYSERDPLKLAIDGDREDGAKDWATIIEPTPAGGAK